VAGDGPRWEDDAPWEAGALSRDRRTWPEILPHGQTGTPSFPVGALTAPTHSEQLAPPAVRAAVARQPLPLASSIVTVTPGEL
jgi:hypothetical protein